MLARDPLQHYGTDVTHKSAFVTLNMYEAFSELRVVSNDGKHRVTLKDTMEHPWPTD